MSLEQLLIDHGPAAVVVGADHRGRLDPDPFGRGGPPRHLPVPGGRRRRRAAGSLLGDCAWYWLGRLRGPRFRAGRLYRRVGRRIERLARRFGVWQLLLARFVYGTKNASMVFWGLQGSPFGRFVRWMPSVARSARRCSPGLGTW